MWPCITSNIGVGGNNTSGNNACNIVSDNSDDSIVNSDNGSYVSGNSNIVTGRSGPCRW